MRPPEKGLRSLRCLMASHMCVPRRFGRSWLDPGTLPVGLAASIRRGCLPASYFGGFDPEPAEFSREGEMSTSPRATTTRQPTEARRHLGAASQLRARQKPNARTGDSHPYVYPITAENVLPITPDQALVKPRRREEQSRVHLPIYNSSSKIGLRVLVKLRPSGPRLRRFNPGDSQAIGDHRIPS